MPITAHSPNINILHTHAGAETRHIARAIWAISCTNCECHGAAKTIGCFLELCLLARGASLWTVDLWQSGFSKSTTIETISVPGNQAYMPVSTVLCLGAKINWHNLCHVRTFCHYQKCINVLLSAVTCMDY